MIAIDTHCHLSHTLKRGLKLNTILQHAQRNNVIAMIDSPVHVSDYLQSIRFHKRYPDKIFITLGAPPANYHEINIDELIASIKDHAEVGEIVGVGEVGLDYHWVKKQSIRTKQHETFKRFIKLANEQNLPLTVHSRDAENDSVDILSLAETLVIMHSFSGDVETALECVNRGYYISIPTAVTTRKKYRRLAEAVPLENLITETDSPYLSPFPDKKRNEPANVIYAVKEIAKIKELSEDDVAKVTTDNAIKIFNLKF
ncbi:MAG: TatD family deoxyribonuclease [Asgard group archaeon]|nr:TatD family deoxyribonuclease [Asgard group archaeon]